MLVLSRQRDETIMIGDEVEITIVDIRGDKVRLGINAPRTIQVHRKEVYEAITQENEDASQAGLDPVSLNDLSSLTPKGVAPSRPAAASSNNRSATPATHKLRATLDLTPTRIERTPGHRIAQ